MSTQWNQQFTGYMFSKVIECLEQDIWKQISYKRPSNTKQAIRAQNIQIKTWEYKAVRK